MIAASFWSLLSPAIEMAESSNLYGVYAFLPVAGGFLLGAIFVYGTDKLMSYLGINSSHMMICKLKDNIYCYKTSIDFFFKAMTHSSKDKAEIALDDARQMRVPNGKRFV